MEGQRLQLMSLFWLCYFTGNIFGGGGEPEAQVNDMDQQEGIIRIVGKISANKSSTLPTTTTEIHIETPKVIFDHQNNVDKGGSSSGNQNGGHDPLILQLKQTAFPLIGPNYKLVIRDGEDEFVVNQTVPMPKCLYNGKLKGNDSVNVAISTCDQNKISGVLTHQSKHYVIETLSPNHEEFERVKRDTFLSNRGGEGENDHLVLIYDLDDSRKCGLKPQNKKRLLAPPWSDRVKILKESDMTDDDINTPSEAEINTKNVPKKSPRRKRDLLAPKKVIEIAVFVDDELYKKTVSDAGSKADPVEAIQNLVFAYMNSVQLIYQSDSLDTKFQIILVRLEIFKKENKGINKKGGDIEGYLEEFCRWQSKQNPKTSSHPDHWDHGLLLTGVNLYDGLKKYSSVIGLAWVSGMCHPEYSCTINEGHNFESVYVIAHEMGHNLGMNHDGESNSGNHCDSNKYLMSPVLGPGKVTWSSCSNKELQQFLTARSTKTQASCLNDVPTTVARYDFLKEGQRPGEQYNALEQCQQSFGSNFVPHVKPKEPPFEDLCRELWCSNETHALRAHPALEGTDCSAKPYPYGSFCIEGECVPFYPDDVKPITEPDNNDIDENNNNRQGGGVNDQAPYNEVNVDGRPLWFDPIFLEVFEELKLRLEERFGT